MRGAYSHTFPRAIYFIMGVTTGYMLHIYKSDRNKSTFISSIVDTIRRPMLSNWIVTILMLTSIYLPGFIFSFYFEKNDNMTIYNTNIFHIYVAWAFFICTYIAPIILIQLSTYSLANGDNSIVRTVLNWSGWSILARFRYSLMLIEYSIIEYWYLNQRDTIKLDLDRRILLMIGQTVIIYLSALLFQLFFATPLVNLLAPMRYILMRSFVLVGRHKHA